MTSTDPPRQTTAPPEIQAAHLIVALMVLMVLVGVLVWIIPQTLGAGVVNITVRQ